MSRADSKNRIKILLVDDYEDILFLLRENLKRVFDNIDTLSAPTISVARQFLSEHKPDVVIGDYYLGIETGLSLLAEIEKSEQRPIFVLFSSETNLSVSKIKYPKFFFVRKPELKKITNILAESNLGFVLK